MEYIVPCWWALVALAAVASVAHCSVEHEDVQLARRFQRYIRDFNKTYDSGDVEYTHRLLNFQSTLKRIERLNSARMTMATQGDDITSPPSGSGPGTAVYGLTEFSDMSPDEFRASQLQCTHAMNATELATDGSQSGELFMQQHATNDSPPPKWDWRQQSVVTGVKNQKKCGSCWAFAAIEAVESAWAIKTGTLLSLSTQQLISCNVGTGNMGCQGGRYETAFSWLVKNNKTIDLDSEYPYTDSKGATLPCRKVLQSKSPVTLKTYQSILNVTMLTERDILMRAVYYYGPVAITVDAVSWQDYEGGVIQHHCTQSSPDHAVVIVGYDTTGAIPYWIVRNTWGTSWGNGGYLYVEIGKNLCGLEQSPTYVTV